MPEGVSCGERNTTRCIDCKAGAAEVPVRRIDLSAENSVFTPERREITVSAKVLPENSSYKDEIEFRITNVQGIKSSLGEIVSAENGNVILNCKGDGEFYLRALCKNGTDKFTKNEEDVTEIGNNVVLTFGEFDFDKLTPKKIVITGRSELAVNSIHVIFGAENGNTETRVLAEFSGAENYTEREFTVSGISGKRSVSFAFLPGSDFDFKSFRFEYFFNNEQSL